MAHLLRGKQAGISNDLSAGISPELFAPDDVSRFGINSQISATAYDPVQSLLAVGTRESPYGSGQVYVFGQQRVCVTFLLPRKASVKSLQFCADKLVALDSKNELLVFGLENRTLLANYATPGTVTALLTDPSLDWAFLGLQNGVVVIYDLDRLTLAPFKIPNLWINKNPKARIIPIVTLALHPRDVGTLLIGYSEGAVTYSFKQNKPLRHFGYELPPGAPGGGMEPALMHNARHPRLCHALWHPTGTFILTGHDDGSLVLWDPKEGRIITARTLEDTRVHLVGRNVGSHGSSATRSLAKEPLIRIAWCGKQDPDDTGILIAGGASAGLSNGLTFLELGPTPVYTTSSWQVLADYLDSPKRQRLLPAPSQTEVMDFCLMPRASPHHAGAHDPVAVLLLLSSGEVSTLSFPSGHPISPTNQLHLSLTFVHPFVNRVNHAAADRTRWLGMKESRQQGPPLLQGGVRANLPRRRYEDRNILQTAHADGTVRLWDAGHGDEIDNEHLIQVDVARALDRLEDVDISHVSMASASGELAVGLVTGEVVVFRWDRNKSFGRDAPPSLETPVGRMFDISGRADPTLKEGLLPLTILRQQKGAVTALKMSDVGFVAAGFHDGSIAVIDLRGPAVIYSGHVGELFQHNRRSSFRKSNSNAKPRLAVANIIEFGVMNVEGDDYSSILLFVGTNLGQLATFKLLPQSNGGFSVQFTGGTVLDDLVVAVSPINVDTGAPAHASQMAVANLRNGIKTNGVIVVTMSSGMRIFRPASGKGAHKSWDNVLCSAGAVVHLEGRGHGWVGLFGDGSVRAYAIPSLREIGGSNLSKALDMTRLSEASITASGDVFAWTGPSEMAMFNVWGTGRQLAKSSDMLYNPAAVIPARPTISNLQWISGTQHVSSADLDLLIGGDERPMSKRMIDQARADEQQRRTASRTVGGSSTNPAPGPPAGEEGWGSYMQRQLNERTKNLNIVGDSMDSLQENSAGWANDVSKYVNQQKRKAVMGVIGSKFGL
ncbi:MAG: hypothetical protein M1817_004286 [Caeruleum heppii]|nr:MAG: hypothetical protein M1817_004286 [Caeruleum heppii]